MPESKSYIALRSDDMVPGYAVLGAVIQSNENTDPNYGSNMVGTDDPAEVSRATSPSSTWVVPAGGTLRALAILNHNWVGRTVTLSSNLGTIAVLTVPARVGGQVTNIFKDVLGLPNVVGASTYSVAVTGGTTNAEVGGIKMFTSVYEVKWQYRVEPGQRRPRNKITTHWETDIILPKGIRRRFISGTVHGEETESVVWNTIFDSSEGDYRPFLYVHDSEVNDAWWVRMDEDAIRWAHSDKNYVEIPVAFTELSMGLPAD